MNRKQIMLELADERSAIQITELKVEIDKLKAEMREKLTKNYFTVIQQRNKAEKTVAEIKNICNAESYLSPQSTRLLVHKILQKISECEVEE